MMGIIIGILSFFALCSGNASEIKCHHNDQSSKNTEELALRLETKFWTLVQTHETEKLHRLISSIFQGLNLTDVINRDQQVAELTNTTLFSFKIENLIAKRHKDVLVTSYTLFILGINLANGENVSTWQKTKDGWKLISHSFIPLQP